MKMRISFDLDGDTAALMDRLIKAYGSLHPSVSQVAKMLVETGLPQAVADEEANHRALTAARKSSSSARR
jgi:hypothetical protein